MNKLYTIGYTTFCSKSGIDIEQLFNTLKMYGVSYLVDVRSVPLSKQYPQCNLDNLKVYGKNYSIPYIHLPELGAKASPEQDVFSKAGEIFFDDIFPISANKRPEKTELSKEEEIVDFNKFRKEEGFVQGIKRIQSAYDKDFTLAIMCSEKDPVNCHRYFLISRTIEQLLRGWIEVNHIVRNENGEITTITNQDLDKKLQDMILKREEVKKLEIQQCDIYTGKARIDVYQGNDIQSKCKDFCDRYWNLMHGWKKA